MDEAETALITAFIETPPVSNPALTSEYLPTRAASITPISIPATAQSNKNSQPSFSEHVLHQFTLQLESETCTFNRSLLSREEAANIGGVSEIPDFLPSWWIPDDKKVKQRLYTFRERIKTMYAYEKGTILRKLPSNHPGIRTQDGWLPQAFTYDAGDWISRCHKAIGHAGVHKTQAEIDKNVYGISREATATLLKQCITCQLNARNRTRAPLEPIYVERVLERLQIDMIDMSSTPAKHFKWILHIKDHWSKYSQLYALPTKESIGIANCLESFIQHHDIPEIIQADNGREFKGAVLILSKRLGIQIINGRPRHPQTQGLVEQANGVAKTKIRAWMIENDCTYWPACLWLVARQMNNQAHTSLPNGLTPQRVFLNRAIRVLTRRQIWANTQYSLAVANCDEKDIAQALDNNFLDLTASQRVAMEALRLMPTESEEIEQDLYEITGQINSLPENLTSEIDTDLDNRVREHQEAVRERMTHKYAIQHEVETFKIGQILTLKIPVEERSSLDDKRLFVKVLSMPADNKYRLQCAFGVLENAYPTRELNKLTSVLQEDIAEKSKSWPLVTVKLANAARSNSNSDRVALKCSCKGKCSRNKKCPCSRKQQKCSQYCHDAAMTCDNADSVLGGTLQKVVLDITNEIPPPDRPNSSEQVETRLATRKRAGTTVVETRSTKTARNVG